MLLWLMENVCRQNNLQILKLATYSKWKINILDANRHLFRLKRIAKRSYFILLIYDEAKQIYVANLMMQ